MEIGDNSKVMFIRIVMLVMILGADANSSFFQGLAEMSPDLSEWSALR